MQRYLKRIALIIPLLLIISMINFTLDKKNLFRDAEMNKAVELLLNGNSVTGLSVQNRLELSLSHISKSEACPDVMLIGASDCERLNKRFYPNRSIINHWTPGCGLHYQTAIIGLYKGKGCLPKEVVFSFRPFILSKPPRKTFGRIRSPYLEMRDSLGLNAPDFIDDVVYRVSNVISQLFSIKYLIFNLTADHKHVEPLSDEEGIKTPYTLPDLSTENTFNYKNKLSKKLIEETKVPYIEAMENRSEEFETLQSKLIQYLIKEDVKVSLFVMPFHPKLMKDRAFSDKMENWEEYCLRLQSRLDVHIIGSVFPSKYGLADSDFLDVTHVSDQGMEKIFKYHQLIKN